VPRVAAKNRVEIEPLGDSFMRVVPRFGFMEAPNVPKALAIARKHGWTFDIMSTSFFLSRRSVRADARSHMPLWQDRLFIFLAQNRRCVELLPAANGPRGRDRHASYGVAVTSQSQGVLV
jgi:KUP system potassium uptake protein